jgi:cytidylate kinase
VLVNGADVSARIRAPDVSAVVSRVAAHPRVRAVLTDRQRDIARRRDVVMEGRDIGATVAPDAALKVYLTADLSTRAARRAAQLGRADDRDALRELTRSLAERDAADSSRAASPLIAPPDAVILDTTDMSVDDVVATVMEELRFRTGD